jgi:hypothetical protein
MSTISLYKVSQILYALNCVVLSGIFVNNQPLNVILGGWTSFVVDIVLQLKTVKDMDANNGKIYMSSTSSTHIGCINSIYH